VFEKRKPTELEQTYDCIDRGVVSAFSVDGVTRWIESCARCYAFAHLLIMHQDGARVKACPRCLVILHDGEMNETYVPKQQRRPMFRNRIAKYMGGNDGR
jgi:hypothetical protein